VDDLNAAAMVRGCAPIHAARRDGHGAAVLACNGRRVRTSATWTGAEAREVLGAPFACRRCCRAIDVGRAAWEVLPSF